MDNLMIWEYWVMVCRSFMMIDPAQIFNSPARPDLLRVGTSHSDAGGLINRAAT